MRMLGRIALGVFVAVVGLIAVLLVRTLTYKGTAGADVAAVKVAPAIAVDTNLAAQHLSQAVKIQTVSHQDPAEDQPAEWERLHAFLATAYPAAHAAMTREVAGAAKALGIAVHDHLVIGRAGHASFKSLGLL